MRRIPPWVIWVLPIMVVAIVLIIRYAQIDHGKPLHSFGKEMTLTLAEPHYGQVVLRVPTKYITSPRRIRKDRLVRHLGLQIPLSDLIGDVDFGESKRPKIVRIGLSPTAVKVSAPSPAMDYSSISKEFELLSRGIDEEIHIEETVAIPGDYYIDLSTINYKYILYCGKFEYYSNSNCWTKVRLSSGILLFYSYSRDFINYRRDINRNIYDFVRHLHEGAE